MPLTALPPQTVPGPAGWFDYVTVDAARRRVYAAHGDTQTLLIVNADTGIVLKQVKLSRMSGVAVNPANGHVYTGNSRSDSLSEVDPVAGTVVRTVHVQGPVDAIAFDPVLDRIYGDEDDGTQIFVIDAKTFKEIGRVALPGHKPEYIQVNPVTHAIYQNIADSDPHVSAIAVIDPHTLKVARTIPTPDLRGNHPLQYDAVHHVLLVAGENRLLDVYDLAGKRLYQLPYPYGVDQCSYDASRGWLACAGNGITLVGFDGHSPPRILAHIAGVRALHTCAIDPKTGTIFGVWSDAKGSYVGRFVYTP